MPYDPKAIEGRWQRHWVEQRTFHAEIDPARPKYYVLDMFPYPSGEGLHVGHPKGYISTDAIARYKRMRGFNVLHPMGWDAFGLPAEQHAIETGTHPRVTTRRNIDTYRRQLQSLGLSYDWEREIDTTHPGYMRWTQWIFARLFERGLAYEAEVPVNWCPALGTVLSNEEVIDGRSERGGHPVVRVPMKQWMLRITEYAERLLTDLDELDWPEHIKTMQREWIGRSEGARAQFRARRSPGARDRGVHHAPRHALRRHLHGVGTRAPAGGEDHDAGAARRRRGLRRAGRAPERARAPRRGGGQDGRGHRRVRAEPRERRTHPGLDRGLRARELRHGRDHGRARPRRARSRLRHEVRAPHSRSGRGRRRRLAPPSSGTAWP